MATGLGSSFSGGGLRAGTAFIDIKPNMTGFGRSLQTEMRAVVTGISKFTADEFSKSLTNLGGALSTVGARLSKTVSLPLLGLGAVATKFSADFELALSRSVGLAGVAQEEIAGIRKEILALSQETGRGPTELAEALYFIRSSGADASNAMDILEVSAKGAVAGLGETQVIADGLTSALNAYAQSNLTAARAGDILAATVRVGKTEANELANALGYVAPLAAQLGVSFADLGATFAAQSLVGVDTSTIAVNTTQILTSLLKTTPAAEEALNSVGLSAKKDTKEFVSLGDALQGPGGILQVMRLVDDAFGDNEEALNRAFPNVRALRGVMALLAQDSSKVDKVFDDITNSAGSFDLAFGAAADTTSTRLNRALSEVKVGLIAFGDAIAPIAEDTAKAVGDIVGGFQKLPAPVRGATAAVITAGAAIGPLTFLTGKLAQGFGTLARITGFQANLDQFRLGMMGVTDSTGTAVNRMGLFISRSPRMVSAISGIGNAVKGLGVALPILGAVMTIADQLGRDAAPNMERFAKAATVFSTSGIFSGELADKLGPNASKIGEFMEILRDRQNAEVLTGKLTSFGQLFLDPIPGVKQGLTELHHAEDAFKALDETLAGFVDSGNMKAAALLFQLIQTQATAAGFSFEDLMALLPDYANAQEDAANSTDKHADAQKRQADAAQAQLTSLENLIDTLFELDREQVNAENAVANFVRAQEALEEARRNASGESEDAHRTAEREADAYERLSDATDDAADANRKLQEAREDLADFESGVSQRIRDLERQQIVSRRVNTPEDIRQKEIDLLKHDQNTAEERERLLEGISSAEEGVLDAAEKVSDAQENVAEAARERRNTQVQALKDVEQAERDVFTAMSDVVELFEKAKAEERPLGPWLDALVAIKNLTKPGSDLRNNLDALLFGIYTATMGAMELGRALPTDVTGGLGFLTDLFSQLNQVLLAQVQQGNAPITMDQLGQLFLFGQGNTPLTPQQLKFLHDLGVPGFQHGGVMPGRPNEARLAVVHGQEQVGMGGVTVAPTYHFHGSDMPTQEQLDVQNRKLGMRVGLVAGRRG